MSGFFATPPPMEGQGMSQKFARRSAVISGMPATQQEIAATAARRDFNDRTAGIQRQAEADQSKADSQGLGNMVRLMSLMQQQRKDQAQQVALQASPLQAGPDPSQAPGSPTPTQRMGLPNPVGVGPDPYSPAGSPTPAGAYNPSALNPINPAMLALMELMYGASHGRNGYNPYQYPEGF